MKIKCVPSNCTEDYDKRESFKSTIKHIVIRVWTKIKVKQERLEVRTIQNPSLFNLNLGKYHSICPFPSFFLTPNQIVSIFFQFSSFPKLHIVTLPLHSISCHLPLLKKTGRELKRELRRRRRRSGKRRKSCHTEHQEVALETLTLEVFHTSKCQTVAKERLKWLQAPTSEPVRLAIWNQFTKKLSSLVQTKIYHKKPTTMPSHYFSIYVW